VRSPIKVRGNYINGLQPRDPKMGTDSYYRFRNVVTLENTAGDSPTLTQH
jgi:hypothetical protein